MILEALELWIDHASEACGYPHRPIAEEPDQLVKIVDQHVPNHSTGMGNENSSAAAVGRD